MPAWLMFLLGNATADLRVRGERFARRKMIAAAIKSSRGLRQFYMLLLLGLFSVTLWVFSFFKTVEALFPFPGSSEMNVTHAPFWIFLGLLIITTGLVAFTLQQRVWLALFRIPDQIAALDQIGEPRVLVSDEQISMNREELRSAIERLVDERLQEIQRMDSRRHTHDPSTEIHAI